MAKPRDPQHWDTRNGETWEDFLTRATKPTSAVHRELAKLAGRRLAKFPAATSGKLVGKVLRALARDRDFRWAIGKQRRKLARDRTQRACFDIFTANGSATRACAIEVARRRLVGYSSEALEAIQQARAQLRNKERILEADCPWEIAFLAAVTRACANMLKKKLDAGLPVYVSRADELERIGGGLRSKMCRVAFGIIRNIFDADDVTNKTWIALLNHKKFPLEIRTNPEAYAVKAVKRKAYAFCSSRHEFFRVPRDFSSPKQLPQLHRDKAAALKKNNPETYRVWFLKDCEHRSVDVVAKKLGCSVKDAKNRVRTARKHLRVTAPGHPGRLIFAPVDLVNVEDRRAASVPPDVLFAAAEAGEQRDKLESAIIKYLYDGVQRELAEPPDAPKHVTALAIKWSLKFGWIEEVSEAIDEQISKHINRLFPRNKPPKRGTVRSWLSRAQEELRAHLLASGFGADEISACLEKD